MLAVKDLEKRFLSEKEAMRYLGVSKRYIQEVRRNGSIPFYQRGKTSWYEVKDLDEYVLKAKVI